MNDLTDAQLWELLKAGHEDAWERIYREHVDALLRYGRQFCNETSWIEDSIHDLFVDLWRNRSGLAATDRIRPYLLVALRRRLIKLMKKQQRQVDATPDEVDFQAVPAVDVAIIGREMSAEQSERLEQGLNRLSKRQREALYLKYFEGLEYEEMGKAMDISYQSVRNLVFAGLQKLRQYLGTWLWLLAWVGRYL